MTTWIHNSEPDRNGHHVRRAWHIVKAPLAHARFYATYCGREFATDDVMGETPIAATCETCFRYEAKARERTREIVVVEDDGSTHDEMVP